MDGLELWQAISERLDLLDEAVKSIRFRGRDYAEAEAEYRKALAVEELRLRVDDGFPVTLIPDLARGKDDIADLKAKRDCAEANYKSALEAINVNKLRIKVLEAQAEREWGRCR